MGGMGMTNGHGWAAMITPQENNSGLHALGWRVRKKAGMSSMTSISAGGSSSRTVSRIALSRRFIVLAFGICRTPNSMMTPASIMQYPGFEALPDAGSMAMTRPAVMASSAPRLCFTLWYLMRVIGQYLSPAQSRSCSLQSANQAHRGA